MIIRKKYISQIEKSLELVPCVFLVGSRQVGKTSIMRSLNETNIIQEDQSLYINFDDLVLSGVNSFETIFNFIEFIELTYEIDFNNVDFFLFDEVKNIKNFNIILKSLIDKYDDKKFICTSSGNYDWTKGIIDGLAGRCLQINVYPLDFKEFLLFKGKKLPKLIDENIYNFLELYVKEYITWGGYPKVVLTKGKENKVLILKSIVDSIFSRDIREFLKEDMIVDLQKMFVFLGTNIGSPISNEIICSYLGEKVYSIKKYLSILERNFLIFNLYPFSTNKRTELNTKRKVYMSDFGITNYFLKKLDLQEITGEAIEMFVFLNKYYNLDIGEELKFWQNRNKSEIDFIFERQGKIIPIEVKISNRDIIPKIFQSFGESYKERIDYFIRTTKFEEKNRTLNGKKVEFKSFVNLM